MSYNEIISRRIPYDIDGTAVGIYRSYSAVNGISSWASSELLAELNDEDYTDAIGGYARDGNAEFVFWFFFPEKREIEAAACIIYSEDGDVAFSLQGSNDTTNGADGIWETATFPNGSPLSVNPGTLAWRTNVKTISFSTSYKVIRLFIRCAVGSDNGYLKTIHLYGRKAAGETPDDIVFCDSSGVEFIKLNDWKERPEGSTEIKQIYLKNNSLTKVANAINIQFNHENFSVSLDGTSWTPTVDIASLQPQEISQPIYIRNLVPPPLQILGPKAGRTIVTIGSWT